jgi:hypothetical protein
MEGSGEMKFDLVDYRALNARQKENFNFQKISAVLADYGFSTIRLNDDWESADFIAYHVDGNTFLKVQLKGRLSVDKKYQDKDLWIGFRHHNVWYLYPHDAFLNFSLEHLNIATTQSWQRGCYHWPTLGKNILEWLEKYALIFKQPA